MHTYFTTQVCSEPEILGKAGSTREPDMLWSQLSPKDTMWVKINMN